MSRGNQTAWLRQNGCVPGAVFLHFGTSTDDLAKRRRRDYTLTAVVLTRTELAEHTQQTLFSPTWSVVRSVREPFSVIKPLDHPERRLKTVT